MRILPFFILACLFLSGFFAPLRAQAAVPCYTSAEAEAEQAVRILSELMVIGLNCQHRRMPGQSNLFSQYKTFLSSNRGLFSSYESTLINYYRKNNIPNPEKNLNDLRTRLANKISLDAAKMRPDMFCSVYAPRIAKAAKMSEAQIKRWAATFFPSHPTTKPVCIGVSIIP